MKFTGFEKGMGIGGWLTNYKRFNVLPEEHRLPITVGDREHFETYITEWDAANIASMGFDHVRVGFDQIVVEDEPFRYREWVFDLITRFVRACHANGLNVVLNLHKAIGNYCDIREDVTIFESRTLQDRFVALWAEFERRFADEPGVAFELLNEVRNVPPAAWNDLAGEAIRAIRALNPTRKIVVGSTNWNSPDTLPDLTLYDDPNIIYTFHIYTPFEFTHQRGVLQAGPLYYNRALTYPCDDVSRYADYHFLLGATVSPYEGLARIDRTVLERCLKPAFDFVAAHPDKVLWCGEFGTIRHADHTSRENWMRDVIALCKEHGMSYCVWNYLSTPNDGNRFSLVDDDTRALLTPRFARILLGDTEC